MGKLLKLPDHRQTKGDGGATVPIRFRHADTLQRVAHLIGPGRVYASLSEFAKKAFMTLLFLYQKQDEGFSLKIVSRDGQSVRGLNLGGRPRPE